MGLLPEAIAYAAPHFGLTSNVSAKRPFPPDMAQPNQ